MKSSNGCIDEPASDAPRIGHLDSIRGLAAFIVVLNHCYDVLPDALAAQFAWLNHSPFRIIALGKPAVVLFFVLSGFVLALSLMRSERLGYGAFLVRRVCRIYLPFAASILLSALIYEMIEPHRLVGLNAYFQKEIWTVEPSASVLLAHLLMLNRPQDITLNNPMWSLVIEMRISLLFPLLFALTQVRRHAALAFAAASSVIAGAIYAKTPWSGFPYTNGDAAQALLLTLYFAPCFAYGMVLARYRRPIEAVFWALQGWKRTALWIFAFGAMSQNFDLLCGLGAMLIISLSLTSRRAAALLSTPLLKWLGSISYSLYLVHIIVIAALMQTYFETLPVTLVLAMAIIASLAAAQLMYVIVERPAMNLGRFLTRRGERPITAQPLAP